MKWKKINPVILVATLLYLLYCSTKILTTIFILTSMYMEWFSGRGNFVDTDALKGVIVFLMSTIVYLLVIIVGITWGRKLESKENEDS